MLSNGFARPLRLQRKPSWQLALFLVVIHLLALLALLQPLAINPLVHTALFIVVFISVIYHALYFRQQYDGSRYWIWQASGIWQYAGDEQTYNLVSAKSLQTPWFVTLTLASLQQQHRLLIVRDQLDVETFRRLRVRVKLHHDETAERKEEAV